MVAVHSAIGSILLDLGVIKVIHLSKRKTSNLLEHRLSGNIPEVFWLGGHCYRVYFQKSLPDIEGENNQLAGLAGFNQLAIFLASTVDDEQIHPTVQEEVFLHELLHMMSNEYECKLSESQITRLARAIHQFMRLNDVSFYCGERCRSQKHMSGISLKQDTPKYKVCVKTVVSRSPTR